MPTAVEIWCYCLGISALALIGLFFGFYGVECALLGWAISQMDVGDLNQLYLQPAEEGDPDAKRPVNETPARSVVRRDMGGTVVPFPVNGNRTRLGVRKRAVRTQTSARSVDK